MAHKRGFLVRYVCFDRWYSGLENLKHLRTLDYRWLTQLKSNRQVDPDRTGNREVCDIEIGPQGRIVPLKGYGLIRVFRIVLDFDEAQHWATDDLTLTEVDRQELARQAYAIEEYPRGLKQCCGVEKCQARAADAQKNPILLAIRAFVRLEVQRWETGKSWYETKKQVVRQAIQTFCRGRDPLKATSA